VSISTIWRADSSGRARREAKVKKWPGREGREKRKGFTYNGGRLGVLIKSLQPGHVGGLMPQYG